MKTLITTALLAFLCTLTPAKADPGIYPVGAPICVGPGICYQEYCHDTGYCWYEQIR